MKVNLSSKTPAKPQKQDTDYVFYELTRSICPLCRQVIDAQILLRDVKLLGIELLVGLKKLKLPDDLDLDFDEIGRLARLAAETVERGDLGYALFIGEKPLGF